MNTDELTKLRADLREMLTKATPAPWDLEDRAFYARGEPRFVSRAVAAAIRPKTHRLVHVRRYKVVR